MGTATDADFAAAAARGERVVALDGGPALPASGCKCIGCGAELQPPRAYLAVRGDTTPVVDGAKRVSADALYCESCRGARLGPPCAACRAPTSRADGIVALNRIWHRRCLRCSHRECAEAGPLGVEYYEHGGSAYCRTHYLELSAEKCAGCGCAVDGGLRALGRVWHEGCLRCQVSNEPLAPGECYLHEGKPLARASKLKTAPLCHACGEPAVSGRVYADGHVYHKGCFRCVHCREVIGERKFVVFDGEPYLDGCYQKLFGASAGEHARALVHAERRPYAVHVPLLLSLGTSGLAAFSARHAELFPQVRRLLREQGVHDARAFLFAPPAVSKPSLTICLSIPSLLQAEDALPSVMRDRVGQQWDQLLQSVHDAPASKNNPWWSTLALEACAAEAASAAATAMADG